MLSSIIFKRYILTISNQFGTIKIKIGDYMLPNIGEEYLLLQDITLENDGIYYWNYFDTLQPKNIQNLYFDFIAGVLIKIIHSNITSGIQIKINTSIMWIKYDTWNYMLVQNVIAPYLTSVTSNSSTSVSSSTLTASTLKHNFNVGDHVKFKTGYDYSKLQAMGIYCDPKLITDIIITAIYQNIIDIDIVFSNIVGHYTYSEKASFFELAVKPTCIITRCGQKFKDGEEVRLNSKYKNIIDPNNELISIVITAYINIQNTPYYEVRFTDKRFISFFGELKEDCLESIPIEAKGEFTNIKCCSHPRKYKNIISNNLSFFVCPDCKQELKE
jgi:hypothetical protein